MRALSPSFSHARPLTPCVLQDSWEKTTSIVYMTLAQMLCGIAKDLVKLGGKGLAVAGEGIEKILPAFKVTPIDTVAAGDSFNGGLAHARRLHRRRDASGRAAEDAQVCLDNLGGRRQHSEAENGQEMFHTRSVAEGAAISIASGWRGGARSRSVQSGALPE